MLRVHMHDSVDMAPVQQHSSEQHLQQIMGSQNQEGVSAKTNGNRNNDQDQHILLIEACMTEESIDVHQVLSLCADFSRKVYTNELLKQTDALETHLGVPLKPETIKGIKNRSYNNANSKTEKIFKMLLEHNNKISQTIKTYKQDFSKRHNANDKVLSRAYSPKGV